MLPERLKQLREEKGVLQKDIADYLEITPAAYGFYEQGRRQPDPDMIIKLADYYDVSTDYLLGRSKIKNAEIKVLAAHREDSPLSKLPPKALKKLREVLKEIDEEEDREEQSDKE